MFSPLGNISSKQVQKWILFRTFLPSTLGLTGTCGFASLENEDQREWTFSGLCSAILYPITAPQPGPAPIHQCECPIVLLYSVYGVVGVRGGEGKNSVLTFNVASVGIPVPDPGYRLHTTTVLSTGPRRNKRNHVGTAWWTRRFCSIR